MDNSIIEAIARAVEDAPDNTALRLHLADLLLKAHQPAPALDHCRRVLAAQPANLAALSLAAQAAASAGEQESAEGYRRLHEALGGSSQAPPSAPERQRPTLRETPGSTAINDDGTLIPLGSDTPGGVSDTVLPAEVETSSVRLTDVGGMEEVKRRLELAFLGPLRNPEMMRAFGRSTKGGLLLYGPPGCGKTYIARAVAGELGARFIAVGIADVLDMWLGQSERNVHSIFESARRYAPCLLFLDELDAIGRKRSLVRHSAGSTVINQLLVEMDGVGADNEGIFILAATNHPWDVDSALRRPGRFDRTLLVLPPDRTARAAILAHHLKGRPVGSVDLDRIARETEGYSGADLAHICNSAAELAMEDSLRLGTIRPIHQADLRNAAAEVRSSVRAWFETAKNHALFANEGGTYDGILEYMRAQRML